MKVCFGGVALARGLKGGGWIFFGWTLLKSICPLLVSPASPTALEMRIDE